MPGFYGQYFDGKKAGEPYRGDREALEDALALVDLYVRIGFSSKEGQIERLEMRGIVITPQECEEALLERTWTIRHPAGEGAEEADGWPYEIREDIRMAWEHLGERRARTGKEARVWSVSAKAGLSGLELFAYLLAVAVDFDRKYERLFGYLQDDVNEKLPTLGLAASLYGFGWPVDVREGDGRSGGNQEGDGRSGGGGTGEGWRGDRLEAPDWIPSGSRLWEVLERPEGRPAKSMLSRPLALQKRVATYLHGEGSSLAQEGPALGGLADSIEPSYGWDDLILEEPQKKLMRLICDRIVWQERVERDWGFGGKHPYGQGVSAVFYGPPGTGKTMAAQVIAGELGRRLYRVDVSRLVSKYIGETEKNLAKLFGEAAGTGAVLLFDEADAIFAKRSKVSGANDRYANMETGFLLQKFEDYRGISILATNYVNNIDEAFKRRLKYMVRFVFPDERARLKLWQSMLPAQARVEEPLDLECYAARFELTGSAIRDVVSQAAYLAASRDRGIRNMDIREALEIHLVRCGRRISGREWDG